MRGSRDARDKVAFRANLGETAIVIDVAEKHDTVPGYDKGPRIWVEHAEEGVILLAHRDGMDSPSVRVVLPFNDERPMIVETEMSENITVREESL
jgi:hypothetical protein